jgi:hypothetical protein
LQCAKRCRRLPFVHPTVAALLRGLGLGIQQVGHKVAAAATATAIDSVATVGENALKKMRKSQRAAERMAQTGEAYRSPFHNDEETDDDAPRT